MEFVKIKEILKESAEKLGISEYEIYMTSSEETSVGAMAGEINKFNSEVSGGICFRALVDGKMGYASTELIEEGELAALPERAMANAAVIDKPDTVGIFEGSESYLKSSSPDYVGKDADELKAVALSLFKKTVGKDERVQPNSSVTAASVGFTVRIANSHGLELENRVGTSVALASAIVKDNGEAQAGYAKSVLNGEFDEDALATEATETAINKLGAGLVPTGTYNIVIDGEQMATVLSAFAPAFSAENAQHGMSLLKDKVGEKIGSDILNITDDPMREGLDIGTPFDAEGVATYRKTVVEGGVLKTLLHNRETAKRAGVETTANASKGGYASAVKVSPFAFCIEAGDYTDERLFAEAGDGIFITELKGLHAGANAVTGDFSIESAGFLIKDGKLADAVRSFTIAGNFFGLLSEISALGNKVETGLSLGFTVFGAPKVLIKGMSVAGK